MAQARDAGRRRPWRDPMIELGPTRYGKARIRLVKVARLPDRHVVRDLTVAVALEGDFAAAHTDGDQSLVVPTDTMKNTVYALAKDGLTGSIEAFGLTLGHHFLGFEQVERATISLQEHAWAPAPIHSPPPTLHHWTYDLSPFGLENDREIFVATEEPHGLIEATVRRSAGETGDAASWSLSYDRTRSGRSPRGR